MKTPLYDIHQQLGAKVVDFAGWEMPVQYSSILDEHQAVRNKAGLFDVSHMGEFSLTGRDALANLQYLVTNNVSRLKVGQVIYTPMCDFNGGIIDDLLIYRLSEEEYMMVVNASNIDKDFKWIRENIKGNIKLKNVSKDYSLLALQGPQSRNILKKLTEIDLNTIDYYCFQEGRVADIEAIISRTGYTGELGYEIYCSPESSSELWKQIIHQGEEYGILPVGLGARDTLRLEKSYCLYGNDIDQDRNPLEAGLSWTVYFPKGDFIGKGKLQEYKEKGVRQRLLGFKLLGRGIPRHGYQIVIEERTDKNKTDNLNNAKEKEKLNKQDRKNQKELGKNAKIIGVVTSGSYSPTLKENIGLAYIDREYAKIGQEIKVVIRNRPVKAILVKTPFV